MPEAQPVIASEFAASFKGFMDTVIAQAPREESFFVKVLREHFGDDDLSDFPIVGENFRMADHPNLHLAMQEYLEAPGHEHTLHGVEVPNEHMGMRLATFTQEHVEAWQRPRKVPVEYVNVPLEDDRTLACVTRGLYLVHDDGRPMAVLLQGPSMSRWGPKIVQIEVMAAERAAAEDFLRTIRAAMHARNVYRGHVISLELGEGGVAVKFHRLPTITRDGIILPKNVIERIERHAIGFTRVEAKLRSARRHMKRGLLLHGPPGTGKTLTAMHLASQMSNRTIILITGSAMGLIEEACHMARLLQPATIILEDIDLIAEERTQQNTGTNALLFELLNQMDGLSEDADVLFLLTTNRPEILEPALASRPGRIDQAILVPLPDADCRRRLIMLYSEGMTVRLRDLDGLISKTEGVSAAFIRELMRKAALFAADEGGPDDGIVVEDRHINDALHELVVEGGELTKQLLGASGGFGSRRRESCG
ncbi:MAG: ATPase [Candidatus Roseilinea sp.]|nr:MAG: ATPase [Candidatus Roseilinea sp.]